MAGLERFDNQAWDRFFDFVAPDVAQMSTSELDAELQRAGVDISRAVANVRLALDARAAREKLARAREMRATITKAVCDFTLAAGRDSDA